MRHRRPSRSPRLARLVALTVAVLVASVAAPLVGAGPAAAANAPLVTENGIALRISDTAITGSVLDEMEAEIDEFVQDELEAAAYAYSGLSQIWTFDGLDVAAEVDLTFDAVTPNVSVPLGALVLEADLTDIELTYSFSTWWHSPCTIVVEADPPATMTAKARVNTSLLPAVPLPLVPSTGVWSPNPPDETGTGFCWNYQNPGNAFDWTGFTDRADPASPASRIEAEVDLALQGLVDDMWQDNVATVLDSVAAAGFGVTVDLAYTDTHGLVVLADVNATNLTLPAFGGPFDVSTAADAGVTTHIHTLMANTTLGSDPSDIIVSVHPNVTNQYLHAIHQALGGDFGTVPITAAVEVPLLDGADRSLYVDTDWTMYLEAQAPPEAHAVVGGGRPELELPQMSLTFLNPTLDPNDPLVATMSGAVSGIDLTSLGTAAPVLPAYAVGGASWAATMTQADAHAAAANPLADDTSLAPWMRDAVGGLLSALPEYVVMDLQGLYGHATTRYTSGLIYAGDQRWTETFDVA